MECSNVIGADEEIIRNKGSTELAVIAMAWFTLDDFFLRLLKFGLTCLLRKVFGLVEQNSKRVRKHHAHMF